MTKTIYLDNNATTMIDPEVLQEMLPYMKEHYGNPSSMHSFGGNLKRYVDEAREKIANFLGADNDYEIVFTGTGTESNNMAILGVLSYHKDKKHIITTRVEHPAVLSLCKKLEKDGYRVTYVPVDSEGNLDITHLKESVCQDTVLVSVMYANNETGVVFPVEEIGAFLKEKNIVFHVDAVQAAGKTKIDVNKINCDLLAVSGHKLHAPKGIGVLYVRRGTRMRPLFYGGHQERGRRAGTENVPSIIGLGKACEIAENYLKDSKSFKEIKRLRDKLEDGILKTFPNAKLNGNKNMRVVNTANIGFEFIEGEAILLYLDQYGIAASSGSACSSGSLEPSHVLRAMGVPFTSAHGSIRFSLSRFTSESEIDFVLETMPAAINRLLEISPYWDNEKKCGIIPNI